MAGEPLARHAGPDAGQPVVGRDDTGGGAPAVVPLVGVPVKAGEISQHDAAGGRAPMTKRSADQLCDLGPPAVRTDHQRSVGRRQLPRRTITPPDARHGAVVVPQHVEYLSPEAHVGTGAGRGIRQDGVHHEPPRRVQGRGPGAGSHLDRLDRFTVVMEVGAVDGGSPGCDDVVEQPPTVQLNHPAAHQRVGGHGVGAGPAGLQHQDIETRSGEQHGGRGPGAAGADNNHVAGPVPGGR